MNDWFNSDLAGAVLAAQQPVMDEILPCLFGYHLIHMGETYTTSLLKASRIHHRVVVSPLPPSQHEESWLPAKPDSLPLRSDSVDVVVLSHCLEFVENPHEVLREAYRVLIPEGHVLITGFNPWSLWGLRRLIFPKCSQPWQRNFISLVRLNDWLQLLGFDKARVQTRFFRPPIQNLAVLNKLECLEKWGVKYWPFGGAIYTVLAQKRVASLTPIRPKWRTKRRLLPQIVEPSARSFIDE